MKKTIFLLLLSLPFLLFQLSAQEVITESKIEFTVRKPDAPIAVTDNAKHTNLFFISGNVIKHLKYDDNHKIILDKFYTKPPMPFQDLAGYAVDEENKINMYFTNTKNNRYFVKTITASGDEEAAKEFDFKIKKERIIQTINYKNKFYVLTTPKFSSVLKLYKFKADNYDLNAYDLSGERFYKYKAELGELSRLFSERTVEIVEDNIPSAVDITSKAIKIYPKEDQLIITLDHRDSNTRVIYLNLNDNGFKVSNYQISITEFGKNDNITSNSFIYKDNIYQLSVSRKLLVMKTKDLATGKVLKEHSFNNEDEDILFANSPIFQDGGAYSTGTRELSKTRQFLRKMAKSNVGIVAFEKENVLQLSIGGVTQMAGGGVPIMMPGLGAVPIGAVGAFTVSLNPVFYAYDSYGNTRSVYIKCLFNESNMEHLPGPPADNVFDEVGAFADELRYVNSETVFKKDDYFVFGYYDKKAKIYSLLKFEK